MMKILSSSREVPKNIESLTGLAWKGPKDHLVPPPLMPSLDAQGTLWLFQAGVSS